jgi:acyl-coenzyme A synthetase/AMP-(fatty) acid ligase
LNHKVSVLWLTKTLFDNLFYLNENLFKELNYLIVGGEALDKTIVNKLINSSTKPKHFLNGYGPTESTTFTCTYDLLQSVVADHVPIGKAINNRRVYILDQHRNPVPIGVVGELYIGGRGLSRGYLNSPDLTKERFVDNPFSTEEEKENGHRLLYKTGDLVRWLDDGNIEYIGRVDSQVKIRGFRIELGEIEHAMMQIDGIKQVCVLMKERETEIGSSKYLVGYYVCKKSGEPISSLVFQDKLALLLPEYMIPSVFVSMEKFPVTINGKLNRLELPEPDFSNVTMDYIAPSSEIEKELCAIWQKILGMERVGLSDNFFKIGGNSILAIQLSHQMSKALGSHVKVADVFKLKNINELLKKFELTHINNDNVEWNL